VDKITVDQEKMFVDKPKSILALKSLLKLVFWWPRGCGLELRFYGRVAIDFEITIITQI
jgi:hypothetical protein